MDYVFAVSDGMGGALAGEYASRIAVEKITTLLPRSFQQSAQGLATGFADILTELFEQIHRAIVFLGGSYEECAGMETTLSLGWFTPGWLYFAHVGDSRIYSLAARDGTLRQLSHDDTYVGWLHRNGKINEREARSHPQRNVLQKALGGSNRYIEPQVGAFACEPGDCFLLCSDGLVDGLFDDRLADFLQEAAAAEPSGFDALGRNLVNAALDGGSRDNTTALVIRVA
jgi:protein phosphatase